VRLVFCILILALWAPSVSAEPAEVASVGSLRERRMYDEAEQTGRKLWAEELSDHDRAELTIQLALVYTDQALAAAEEEQDALWAKADGACAALLDGYPENRRRRLVEVQRALVSLARGTHDRRMQRTERAIAHLRAAIRQLATIADGVGRELVERQLRPAEETNDKLKVAELESLESHVALHLAQAERQVGLCYAAGTADRDDSLLQATRRLTTLAQRSPADELIWNARVELIACQRELGNPQTAQRLLDAWMRENPPADVVARFKANAEPRPSLEPSKTATTPTIATSPMPKSAAPQVGAAGLAEAAAARSAGNFMSAAEQYREFALASPDDAQAAEAHRLSILSTTDLMRETPPADRTRALEAYETLLREHLHQWPSQPSADDVRMWLGRLLATRKDWPEVISIVQQVRPTSSSFAASLQLIADAYDRRMQSLEQTNAGDVERAKLLAAVTQHLQPMITGTENRWPQPWSELQRDVALQLSRLHVRYGEASSPYAARLLTAALRDEPTEDSQVDAVWTSEARIWLATALARNGDLASAQQLAEQSKDAPPETVLETLQVVVDELPTVDAVIDATERQLGELALAMVRSVDSRSSTLDGASLVRLNAGRAAALAAVGDRNAALMQYGALVGESPKNTDIQGRYAELLAAANEPKELRQSLAIWQAVEARSRRGSERWQRARHARIALLTRLGETGEAEKLLNLTRLLYPNWESTE
jgi:hypothetical protein